MDQSYHKLTSKLKDLKPLTVFPKGSSDILFSHHRLKYLGEDRLRQYLHELAHVIEPNEKDDRIWKHGSIHLHKMVKRFKADKRETRCVQIENIIRRRILKTQSLQRITFIGKEFQDPKRSNISFRIIKKRLSKRKDILVKSEYYDREDYDFNSLPYLLRSLNLKDYPQMTRMHSDFVAKAIKDLTEGKAPYSGSYALNGMLDSSIDEFVKFVKEVYFIKCELSPTRFSIKFDFSDYH